MDGDVRFGEHVDSRERVFPEGVVFSGDFGKAVFFYEGTDQFAHPVHSEFADSRKIAAVEIGEDVGSGGYGRCVFQLVS